MASSENGNLSFFDIVHRQRACRSFLDQDVPDELVEKVLDAATFAPSAENRQPWVFVVVRHPVAHGAIADLTRRAWHAGGRDHSQAHLPPAMFAEVDQGAEGALAAAPVLILVCADTVAAHEATLPSSIFPAVQNLLLAATALGLGSALTTLPLIFGEEVQRLLRLPPHVKPLALVPLGWPARKLGRPKRSSFRTKTYRDRYGSPW